MTPAAVPIVGTTGNFILKPPFDKDVIADQTYVCIAVRRLDELIAQGVDPYAEYYVTPHEVTQQDYQRDLINRVSIITLRSDAGHLVFVPGSYIDAFPSLTGVPYRPVALVVGLGALPEKLNLGLLKSEVTDLVKGVLGIKSVDIVEAVVGQVENMDGETHRQVEAARKAAITRLTTDRSLLLEAQKTVAKQAQMIKLLEAEVIRLKKPGGSTPL